MKCKKCGNDITENSIFCNNCGTPIKKAEEKSSNNNSIIVTVIVGIAAIILGILIGYSIKGCPKCIIDQKNTDNTTTTNQAFNDDERKPTVNIDASKAKYKVENDNARSNNLKGIAAYYDYNEEDKYNNFYVLMENNNNEMVDAHAYINFYKNGVRIGSESTSEYSVRSNHKFIFDFSVDFNEEYDDYDISYYANVKGSNRFEMNIDDSKVETLPSGGSIVLNYMNDSDKTITYRGGVILYKGDNIVGIFTSISTDVVPNSMASMDFHTKYKNIDYDKYEGLIYSSVYRTDEY